MEGRRRDREDLGWSAAGLLAGILSEGEYDGEVDGCPPDFPYRACFFFIDRSKNAEVRGVPANKSKISLYHFCGRVQEKRKVRKMWYNGKPLGLESPILLNANKLTGPPRPAGTPPKEGNNSPPLEG